jgi:GT2 family glycosyltransferase
MPLWLKSKIMATRVLTYKIIQLVYKSYKVFRTNPRLLPGKVHTKFVSVLSNRLDLRYFQKNKIRIGGQFYDSADLAPCHADISKIGSLPQIAVIIPVYRDLDITKRCIDSVCASNIPPSCRIIILNDFSPDPGMKDLLDGYKLDPRVEVIHNAENLGFVRNVNNGMKLAEGSDVVLLNSDTIVAGDWLCSLYAHSTTNSRISSVTASSNNATICSFPSMDGSPDWPFCLSTSKVNSVLSHHNRGRAVKIPTAVGFCMYITRRSIDDLGMFDAEAFGKGYGEENDFCLRGIKKGWIHLQALDAAVFHQGEVSFGISSHPGKLKAAQVILSRYPNYDYIISNFARKDPARVFRLGAILAILAESGKRTELIFTHIHGGGVDRAVKEFVESQKQKVNFLVIQLGSAKGFYRISSLVEGVDFSLEFSSRYSPEVFQLVVDLAKVSKAHIHHVMDFDAQIMELLKSSNLPFDFYIHDYWTICPQITLTTAAGRYCGEPDTVTCNNCIAERAERGIAPIPAGFPGDILQWRQQHRWLFDLAANAIAPSHDTADRMRGYFPGSNITVRYHEPQAPLYTLPVRLRGFKEDKKLRVAILGSIGTHKGLLIASEVQGEIRRLSAPLDLKIFGTMGRAPGANHKIPSSGNYLDVDLAAMLEDSGVQIVWFPEGFPETYSYTLSHAMKNAYPIIAPNIGAFPERIKGRPWSRLTPICATSGEVVASLLELRSEFITELDS